MVRKMHNIHTNKRLFKFQYDALVGKVIDATTVVTRETIEAFAKTIVLVAKTTVGARSSIAVSTIGIGGWWVELVDTTSGGGGIVLNEASVQCVIQNNLLASVRSGSKIFRLNSVDETNSLDLVDVVEVWIDGLVSGR